MYVTHSDTTITSKAVKTSKERYTIMVRLYQKEDERTKQMRRMILKGCHERLRFDKVGFLRGR